MEFRTWKVRLWKGNCSFSLRSNVDPVPVILNQDQFARLFPEVGLESVPEAPETATMRIEANVGS